VHQVLSGQACKKPVWNMRLIFLVLSFYVHEIRKNYSFLFYPCRFTMKPVGTGLIRGFRTSLEQQRRSFGMQFHIYSHQYSWPNIVASQYFYSETTSQFGLFHGRSSLKNIRFLDASFVAIFIWNSTTLSCCYKVYIHYLMCGDWLTEILAICLVLSLLCYASGLRARKTDAYNF